jgi:prepilin-type N-terminal cleavage/methylation domain-containing protein
MTLVEVMIALVVLGIGILAVAQLFPHGAHAQVDSRMLETGVQYANEQFEKLRSLTSTDPALAAGRHPATGFDSLGTTRAWLRSYVISSMPAPLNSLLRLDVTVQWKTTRPESIAMSGYLNP